jgi:serine/threonine protein kinase
MGFFGKFKSMFAGGGGTVRRRSRCNIRERFELLREAIYGTMSKFYMARDKQDGRIVGLKILDMEKLAQFEGRLKGAKRPSEGEIATQLKHPNIVETYEYGLTTEGDQYMVMEYIEGPGLNTLVIPAQSHMLDGIRLPLIRQIAEAVGAVHAAGFIHRDVSPRNVMVEPNSGVLKLIDFGLTIPNKPEFLQPGNRTGNPNYMAPEIIKRKRTDYKVDIFAFGVSAYEVCASELPWQRGTDAQAAMQHDTQPPTDLRRYRPNVNAKLAEAITWCIERDPVRRCPSMEEFLKKIRGVTHEDDPIKGAWGST